MHMHTVIEISVTFPQWLYSHPISKLTKLNSSYHTKSYREKEEKHREEKEEDVEKRKQHTEE